MMSTRSPTRADRFLGCLLGQAIGDAVGSPVEGMSADTDTLAAMTGALSGAHLGVSELPAPLVNQLENGKNGRDVIAMLAQGLHDRTDAVIKTN